MSQKPIVIVIDDEPEICELLTLFLEDDFDVKTFSDPRLAMESFEPEHHVAIVSDIKMPHLSGLEVLRFVKQKSPSTTVVLITGHAQTERDQQHANELGAAGILFKPFGEPSKVVEFLKVAIAQSAKGAVDRSVESKPMIMVIDDEIDILEVVKMLLSDTYDVQTYDSPNAAIGDLLLKPIQLVLTDLNMPQIRSKDLVRSIRELAPNVPILIMSGHTIEDPEVQEALHQGAAELVPKPLPSPHQISGLIGKYIA